ncbi:hypothetical protein GPECTOR_51g719 [Gonium pectorale]|uniref:Carboxylic ester hydrolase n=1 Tax=Gonium pectorale TaxID=33097 RepID=A0A150G7J0_GONPE|nr:hypothetical protein GPECTOR_51g719 [Gonium pectorale]|eukprot:KXZ45733.1 hypothetical protein GPECTOR_51g719 [Gonium pectorale]
MQPDVENASEDCLFLNIWTPTTDTSAKLPVRVFIHGGGFQTGSGSDFGYGGCQIANDSNVVAVTINYRLGVLGFLALPGLEDSTAGGTTGTWGLLDQRSALGWIQRNIRAFGGDPAKVMITGQSAGGYSVMLHTVMPGSAGLFSSAAPVSGSADVMAFDFLKDAYAKGRAVADALQCNTGLSMAERRTCLLNVRADVIVGAQKALGGWGQIFPAIDGKQIPKAPLLLMQEGKMARVPMLFGMEANEGVLEASAITQFNFYINKTQFLDKLRELPVSVPPAFESRLFKQYNERADGSWFLSLTHAITDAGYWCPAYRAARYFSRHSSSPTRYYITNTVKPMSGCFFNLSFPGVGGLDAAQFFDAYHGYSVPLSFMVPQQYPDACAFKPAELQFSSFLSGILSNFAANRTPLPPRSASLNQKPLAGFKWPSWNSSDQKVLWLEWGKPGFIAASELLGARCKIWDDILDYNIKRGTSYDM